MGNYLAVALAAFALATPCTVQAEPPPELAAQVRAIGPYIDPAATAALYAPLHAPEPYAGVVVARGLRYGPGPRHQMDVFRPAATPRRPRPVLVFLPGGAGDLREPIPGGAAFYDNVMLWAVKNGFVGVSVMRESGPGTAWDAGAANVADALAWVRAHASDYGADPARIIVWGHSSGANALALYLGLPKPADAPKLLGAILMGGSFNLAPLTLPPLETRSPPAAPPPPEDPALALQRSVLPGLKQTPLPLYVSMGTLEPKRQLAASRLLRRALCEAGRCPAYGEVEGHGHLSLVFSINTADDSSTRGPLAWMRRLLR